MRRLRPIRRSILVVCVVCLIGCVWWTTSASADRRAGSAPLRPACAAGSQVDVVAHPDDDLLFMNPDLLRRVAARGWCTTTIVLTAGNAGEGIAYTRSREHGLRAAYAAMAGVPDEWVLDTPTIGPHRVERSVLAAAPGVRLEFLRLPDGNLDGSGFAANGSVSLQRLTDGRVAELATVDPWPRSQRYSLQAFRSALRALIDEGRPTVVRTLDHVHQIGSDVDHSDHLVTGAEVRAAAVAAVPGVPVVPYLGYSSAERAANLSPAAHRAKVRAFLAYAADDDAVCGSVQECDRHPDGKWLRRMYQADDGTDGATAGEVAATVPAGED